MELKEEIRQIRMNAIRDKSQLWEKLKQHPLLYLIILSIFVISLFLLFCLPHWQVSHFKINNPTTVATLENQYRATLAQIIGGIAVLLGLYFAWGNLKIFKESQITERFTRAIDQLGNNNIQVRVGGIYALGRISEESEKDYWSIIEFLTSYVKTRSVVLFPKANSKIEQDIQAALSVIGRRKHSFESKDLSPLDMQGTFLREANLKGANLRFANLQGADLEKANLQGADLRLANIQGANLKKAYFQGADLKGADLKGANLQDADFKGVNLEGTKGLSIPQLSKVSSLCNVVKLDNELFISLKNTYPDIFEDKDE